MSDTITTIHELQAEYDALERQGAEKFGGKARQLLEKQLRDEMKKKLDAVSGDRDAFKARKGEVFRKLHAAKELRRAEIEAAVADGAMPADDAQAEIIALGWESGVAKAAIAKALKQTADHVTTAVELPPQQGEDAQHPEGEAIETSATPTDDQPATVAESADSAAEIMDPVGAEEPVTRSVEYAEPGRDQPQRRNRRK